MRFVVFPNFIAVSTCSLDFFEALLQLVPAPLSGLFFIRVLLGTTALLAARSPPNRIDNYAHGAGLAYQVNHLPPSCITN